jgi:HEAT repeat protein
MIMKILKLNLVRSLLAAGLLTLPLPAANGAQTESDLIAVLESGLAAVQKCEACQKLRLVGTARAVPALAALLNDERVSQAARFALEALPAPEADLALREALGKTSGLLQAGVVDSIGWRRDASAVPLLEPLLTHPDPTIARAAAAALGRIGGPQALKALNAARTSIAAAARPALFEALLRCAEQLLAEGKTALARPVFESLAQPAEPEEVRVAAHAGLIRCAGDQALARIKSALEDPDPAAQVAALQLAGSLQGSEATAVFTGLLPTSPPAMQVALLALLRTRGDAAALPAAQAALRSPDPAVRVAALAALGELGDAGSVPMLAEAATSRDALEQRAARQALESLHRGEVAGALVAQLGSGSPALQAELIRALTARHEQTAVPALLELARSARPAERDSALRALGSLADPSHSAALVELLAAAREAEGRAQVVDIFGAIAERAPEGKGLDTDALVRGIATGNPETRKALLDVCALFVNEPLRAALRSALSDRNEEIRSAAARALCHARDPNLLPDLLALARRTSETSLRSLALAGIVRLATDETAALPVEKRAEFLAAAFELAGRVEDKRQVLSGLGRVPHPATLALVQKAAEDPAVRAEASAARAQIVQKLGFKGPFIQDWLVSGPYRKEGVVGALAVFNIPFDPEEPDAQVRWQGVPRADHVNLAALFPGQDNCAAYLKAQIVAPAAVDALLLLGTDDGVKAWLNGQMIHANNVDRGEVVDQDQVAIHLLQGTNTLLLKITQGGGGWSARARIVGADGQPIAGLETVPQNAPPVRVRSVCWPSGEQSRVEGEGRGLADRDLLEVGMGRVQEIVEFFGDDDAGHRQDCATC